MLGLQQRLCWRQPCAACWGVPHARLGDSPYSCTQNHCPSSLQSLISPCATTMIGGGIHMLLCPGQPAQPLWGCLVPHVAAAQCPGQQSPGHAGAGRPWSLPWQRASCAHAGQWWKGQWWPLPTSLAPAAAVRQRPCCPSHPPWGPAVPSLMIHPGSATPTGTSALGGSEPSTAHAAALRSWPGWGSPGSALSHGRRSP